jgi:hypothetical protein
MSFDTALLDEGEIEKLVAFRIRFYGWCYKRMSWYLTPNEISAFQLQANVFWMTHYFFPDHEVTKSALSKHQPTTWKFWLVVLPKQMLEDESCEDMSLTYEILFHHKYLIGTFWLITTSEIRYRQHYALYDRFQTRCQTINQLTIKFNSFEK